jgi:hypothetical protein
MIPDPRSSAEGGWGRFFLTQPANRASVLISSVMHMMHIAGCGVSWQAFQQFLEESRYDQSEEEEVAQQRFNAPPTDNLWHAPHSADVFATSSLSGIPATRLSSHIAAPKYACSPWGQSLSPTLALDNSLSHFVVS